MLLRTILLGICALISVDGSVLVLPSHNNTIDAGVAEDIDAGFAEVCGPYSQCKKMFFRHDQERCTLIASVDSPVGFVDTEQQPVICEDIKVIKETRLIEPMTYYHNNGIGLRAFVLLWMALLSLPLLAWRFLTMLEIFPCASSPMGGLDFASAKLYSVRTTVYSDMLLLTRNGFVSMIVSPLHMLVAHCSNVNDTALDTAVTTSSTAAATHALAIAISSPPRSNNWPWMRLRVHCLFLLLVVLAPVLTAGEAAALATATLVTSTLNTTAATINNWTSLSSSIERAAGKKTTLTLSASFSGYTAAIIINTAFTNVTIVGNGATLNAQTYGRFFEVGKKAVLAMSNVTLRNGKIVKKKKAQGGAVYVAAGGAFTVTSTTFSGNTVDGAKGWADNGQGGAVYVAAGGAFTVTSTTFSDNSVAKKADPAQGGAVYVAAGGGFTVTSTTFSGNTAVSSMPQFQRRVCTLNR
jgi:hypothetical protein